jgi:hypothetical protein
LTPQNKNPLQKIFADLSGSAVLVCVILLQIQSFIYNICNIFLINHGNSKWLYTLFIDPAGPCFYIRQYLTIPKKCATLAARAAFVSAFSSFSLPKAHF